MICGLNGCGKSTLGRAVAEELGYKRMDVEDYYFLPSPVPYSVSRTRDEVRALMLEDVKKNPRFVLSSVRADWGKEINARYALAVVLSAPKDERLERIRRRETEKFHGRVLPGGDMYEQQRRFSEMVASRTDDMVEAGLIPVDCPVLRLNAMETIEENTRAVLAFYEEVLSMQETLKVLVRYHADIPPIEKLPQGDWIDLRAAETVDMKAGEFRRISLGVSMKLPKGYEAHLLPRSSTFQKWGVILANGMGVIDESYCGDGDIWRFSALAMRDTHIEKGDRICQFRLMEKMRETEFERVEFLSGENRGGFGSTGEK